MPRRLQFEFISHSDIVRIRRVCFDNGVPCTSTQAYLIWHCHSASWDAGWLGLPDSDVELFEIIEDICINKVIKL